MMKYAVLAALLSASASAFAPAQRAHQSVALNAERSASLPFMNRPPLVSCHMVLLFLQRRLRVMSACCFDHCWRENRANIDCIYSLFEIFLPFYTL